MNNILTVFEEKIQNLNLPELGPVIHGDPSYSKRSAWVVYTNGDDIRQLQIWDSGEAEFETSDPKITPLHYQLDTETQLETALGELVK